MTETKMTILKDVLVDVRVEADLSGMLWCRYRDDPEQHAKDLERAVKDFHDFLRDHRSQDMITLDVVRITQNLCAACGQTWERDMFDGKPGCDSCGALLEETETIAQEKEQ